MYDFARTAEDLFRLGSKIAEVYTRKVLTAQNNFVTSFQSTVKSLLPPPDGKPTDAWQAWPAYSTDCFQRWVLFCDTLRQRGNNFIEHERAGKPPLLVFEHETIVDGRKLARPVNYALVRIIPPAGVTIDETQRPFIIIDPRRGTVRGSVDSNRTRRLASH